MSDDKQLAILQVNPYAIAYMDTPTDEMKMTALRKNGLVIQHIKEPTEEMMKAAVDSMPRALQYIAHPSKELLRYVVDRWNNLSLIDNPDDELIHAALAQSGWAIPAIRAITMLLRMAGEGKFEK